MQHTLLRAVVCSCLLFFCSVSISQDQQTAAKLLNEFPAEEATQAVAADAEYFYAIANSRIGKYSRSNGERVGAWNSSEDLDLKHLNSGIVIDKQLYCCNSNFPKYPEVSSIEVFSTSTLEHIDSHSFGIYEGSLTWIDRHEGHWWAVFAHYSEKVNDNPLAKSHAYTSLVQFDNEWRRVAGWVFPESVLVRFDPHSCSGGFWGPEEKIYCTGHDLGEIYLLSLPKAGSVLKHECTITAPITGQGIAWSRETSTFFGINRPKGLVVEFLLPN